ncbi:APC family permease [Mycoplasmopsis alligatoris]|uniref:Amino acid permease n=1 Tax=Mycoplasmopsis alligatoris A21JP2 TaxID=747682 RepID=D4XWM7_9BACT|nr:APC family permease [Mycoplasmopsis alligatoris]EFF41115.1 amino acid permease [Mycoplasmopsis alligatoris A21JP2]
MTKKFNERQFILYGLNYIVGFGFIATISNVIKNGWAGSIVFILITLISVMVALTFSRAAKYYPDEIGSTYSYSRKVFSKRTSFYFGWNAYIQGPILSAASPLFFTQIIFVAKPEWQNYELLVSLISVFIFIGLYVISALGLHISKPLAFITGALKFVVIFIALILVVELIFKEGQHAYFIDNITTVPKDISAYSIAGVAISFLYAFGGLEGLVSIGKDSDKINLRKVLMIIFFIVFASYFTVYVIFLNLPTNLLTSNNLFLNIYAKGLPAIGIALFAIGLFFNRASGIIMGGVINARILVVLAQDGYFPKLLAKENKNGEFSYAIVANLIITFASMIIFNLIPRLINQQDAFQTVLELGTAAFLIQYISTTIIVLFMNNKKLIGNIKIWELVIYWLGIIIGLTLILLWAIPNISGVAWTSQNTIQIVSYIAFILVGYVIYYGTFMFKKHKDNKSNTILK